MSDFMDDLGGWFKSQGLSKSEVNVAMLMMEPLTNRKIGEKLFVCEKTIKFHAGNIYKKLKVKSRVELLVKISQVKGNWEKRNWRVIEHV